MRCHLSVHSDLETAAGWSAADDRALQAAARAPPRAAGAPPPAALRNRRREEVEARCAYLGCVVPRVAAA